MYASDGCKGLCYFAPPKAEIKNSILPVLDGMMTSGLVTIEKVQVLQYGTTMP
jgi:hypothetical protein